MESGRQGRPIEEMREDLLSGGGERSRSKFGGLKNHDDARPRG